MEASVAAGREAIRRGSKSFAAASVLLDRQARESAWGLYAWCRYCDDVVDGQAFGGAMTAPALGDASPAERLDDVRRLTVLAVETDQPVPTEFALLRRVARSHAVALPSALELLDGFAMDVEGRGYVSLHDTLDYAYHVAGVVGVMMAQVMGVRDRPTLERACDLGIAFQLTNIARDVMEDARGGRIYLPAEWLADEGVGPTCEAVLAQANRPAVARTTARLLHAADAYYRSARAGLQQLPVRRAWAIAAARDVYREIGRTVVRRGPAAWDQRVGSTRARKLLLLGRGGLVAAATRLPLTRPSREGLWTMPG